MHGWPAKPTSQPFFSDLQLTCSTLHFGHFFSLLQRTTSATSYPARIGVHVCPQEFSILDPIDGIDKAGAGGPAAPLIIAVLSLPVYAETFSDLSNGVHPICRFASPHWSKDAHRFAL